MRKEIQSKLRQVGLIKPHLAVYIVKDILGDDSANSSQNQTEILERLSTAIYVWRRCNSRHQEK